MDEREIDIHMMKSALDRDLSGLTDKTNTRRVAELIVDAGIRRPDDLKPAGYLTALFLAHAEEVNGR